MGGVGHGMSGCAPIRGREENRGGKGSTGTRLIKAGKLGGVTVSIDGHP